MAGLKALAKEQSIYGMSSIIGRFLNYLLVPIYTNALPVESGGYGIITNMYAITALLMVRFNIWYGNRIFPVCQ